MADYDLRGWHPNLKINNTLFDHKGGEPRCTRSTAPGDTVSNGRYRVPRVDKESFSFSGTAIRQSNLNPHASPLNIMGTGQDVVSLKYWPNYTESGDDTKAWRCATFVITEYSESYDADNGLLTIRFSGESQGIFYRPGDA